MRSGLRGWKVNSAVVVIPPGIIEVEVIFNCAIVIEAAVAQVCKDLQVGLKRLLHR